MVRAARGRICHGIAGPDDVAIRDRRGRGLCLCAGRTSGRGTLFRDDDMSDTVFGKIARGEIPATIVAQSARCLAFRDLAPQAPVHVLVIPKTAYATLNDVDDPSLLGELMTLARDVARQEGLADDG